jgi:serine/threonine protein kinase
MNAHRPDETAISGSPPPGGADDATEAESPPAAGTLDSASGPTDVTVVRGGSSAASGFAAGEPTEPDSFGKYELLGEVARGGMGVVYRARQHGLDRLVALKMVLGTGGRDGAQRFLQEARAAAALDHPNVVPIYDTGEIGGKPYFTMALIEGPNLRAFVESSGTLPIPTAVSLFAQIVAGVAHAHRHGIVHRDLKPANVLVDKDGRPRVTDFGLAKRAATDTQLTATGQVVGTPQYMAPEQARESKDVGPPADVYSLGTILYFLLTGRAPFQSESFADLLVKVLGEQPEPPRALRPEVPEDLDALCLRCLEKKPADRFPDANELLAALAPVAERYVGSSANLTPTLGSIPFPRPRSAPSIGSAAAAESNGSRRAADSSATLPDAPPPRAGRKPLLIALGVAAALLVATVAVVAVIASRGTPDGTAQQQPPGVAQGQPPAPPTPTPTPTPVAQREPAAWPAPGRNDFDLKVRLDAPGKQDRDGKLLLHAGTAMTVRVTAEKDCRVSVWLLEPSGDVQKLFPNDDDPDDHFAAGAERTIPGNDAYTLEATPTEGPGAERLRVIATTGERPAFPPGARNGRFAFYAGASDREKIASAIRGIVIKKASASAPEAVSERELQFRVTK